MRTTRMITNMKNNILHELKIIEEKQNSTGAAMEDVQNQNKHLAQNFNHTLQTLNNTLQNWHKEFLIKHKGKLIKLSC